MGETNFRFESGSDLVLDIDLTKVDDLDTLRRLIGNDVGVVKPEGISFHHHRQLLDDIDEIKAVNNDLRIQVDGHGLRQIPGLAGLPIFGSYLEVYSDHLGNNQRLFEKYGPIFQTNNLGKVVCQTNDPEFAEICMIKKQACFSATNNPDWYIVHKFLPPALGPKAVRHYAPQMNKCCDESFPVFDELENHQESWNVYQFMLKLSSGTVGKIMLGMEFEHFSSIDAPLNKMVLGIAENLAINKRMSSRGEWYSHLPFGDPVRLKQLRQMMSNEMEKVIEKAKSNETEYLQLQEAVLKASNIVDYLVRAADSKGAHLPKENLMSAVFVATGAGFTTTSSLLSWCLYGLVTHPGAQARLLQELIDHDITDESNITVEMIDNLLEATKFVKEIQRRHNPSYQPGRTAQRDMVLPGGYRMKKGAVIIVALHHIHNNPKVWNKPYSFDPERWDTPEVKNMSKTSYIPFAYGQRMCIGFNFAMLEVKMFVCKLVYRYHWEKEGDSQTEYDPYFQLIRPSTCM